MNIKFMYNDSSNNVIGKNITQKFEMQGTIKDDCSIINPVITVQGNLSNFVGVNYAKITLFDRYYFVNDIVSRGADLVQISMHVDVLESFKDELYECEGIVNSQESKYNLYLDDGSFRAYQNPIITTKKFPSGFTSESFVLSVAGS